MSQIKKVGRWMFTILMAAILLGFFLRLIGPVQRTYYEVLEDRENALSILSQEVCKNAKDRVAAGKYADCRTAKVDSQLNVYHETMWRMVRDYGLLDNDRVYFLTKEITGGIGWIFAACGAFCIVVSCLLLFYMRTRSFEQKLSEPVLPTQGFKSKIQSAWTKKVKTK